MDSSLHTTFETYIQYSKVQIPSDQIQSKEPLIFLHPLNGRIITDKEYKVFCSKTEDKPISPKKRKYPSYTPLTTSSSLFPKTYSKIDNNTNTSSTVNNNKLFPNWSINKLDDEMNKIQIEIDKISKDEVTEEEIEKYNSLSSKWKKIAQEAVCNLLELYPRNDNYENNTIGNVIKSFNLDPSLIEYDEENDCFND